MICALTHCACRESNPGHKHGKLVWCRYTTCARKSVGVTYVYVWEYRKPVASFLNTILLNWIMMESALEVQAQTSQNNVDTFASLHCAKNIPNSLFLHHMTRATGYGATAVRLTPDQKGGSSNLSALILLWICISSANCGWPTANYG